MCPRIAANSRTDCPVYRSILPTLLSTLHNPGQPQRLLPPLQQHSSLAAERAAPPAEKIGGSSAAARLPPPPFPAASAPSPFPRPRRLAAAWGLLSRGGARRRVISVAPAAGEEAPALRRRLTHPCAGPYYPRPPSLLLRSVLLPSPPPGGQVQGEEQPRACGAGRWPPQPSDSSFSAEPLPASSHHPYCGQQRQDDRAGPPPPVPCCTFSMGGVTCCSARAPRAFRLATDRTPSVVCVKGGSGCSPLRPPAPPALAVQLPEERPVGACMLWAPKRGQPTAARPCPRPPPQRRPPRPAQPCPPPWAAAPPTTPSGARPASPRPCRALREPCCAQLMLGTRVRKAKHKGKHSQGNSLARWLPPPCPLLERISVDEESHVRPCSRGGGGG